jgi:hypothetical protein
MIGTSPIMTAAPSRQEDCGRLQKFTKPVSSETPS